MDFFMDQINQGSHLGGIVLAHLSGSVRMDGPLVRVQPRLLGKPHPAGRADERRLTGVDPGRANNLSMSLRSCGHMVKFVISYHKVLCIVDAVWK